jgi:methionyl-tRNA formyltransferase
LRVVFFGTSSFAAPALRRIAAEHGVVAVVTQPDRPAGRGHKLVATPIRLVADELRLPVRMPTRLRDEVLPLAGMRPDVFVVASYGRILPEGLLGIPRLGPLNIHPSRLPLYRGANPVAAPIRDGRTETALSVIYMDAGLDTGDIIAQELTTIGPRETGTALHDRLAEDGARILSDLLKRLARGEELERIPQAGLLPEEEIAQTLTRPVLGEELLVDWNWPARRIVDHIRAYADKPVARGLLAGERMKLLEAEPAASPSPAAAPGTWLGPEGDGLLIACGDGALNIRKLIPPGRNAQTGAEFARRHRTESQ